MEPDPNRTPDILRKPAGGTPPPQDEPEVGDFRPGSPFSQWALGRYLVGRALTESIGTSLLIVALAVFAVAAVAEWLLHSTLLAVLLVIVAVFVLLMRWVLLAVVRRLTSFSQYAPIEERINTLVAETRGDVFRELRRVGLPSHMWTLPLLPIRLLGSKRRPDTVERMRAFELARVVPKARIDETFLLLRQAGTGGRSSSRP
ncbi:MAG TPA: hypothetical protein VFE19_11390 [Jatrophihabitantaceae bacterium]|nr:hypothetical protein [Jatrophihabitantaceae bacterium]